VVGVYVQFLAPPSQPALSRVRLPIAEMARIIVERVIARLADPGIGAAEFIFAPELVARRSVAPPRTKG